jgi:hypothetical protein
MERLAYPRREWEVIARELGATDRENAPAGLRERVATLLAGTPRGWADQTCELELDATSARVVRAILRRGGGTPADPGLAGQQGASVAEAEAVVRDHQAERDHDAGRGPPAPGGYRVEHRAAGVTTVLGHTEHVHARQAELSRHAARLIAAGAAGELVLVDEATGEEVARRSLRPAANRKEEASP